MHRALWLLLAVVAMGRAEDDLDVFNPDLPGAAAAGVKKPVEAPPTLNGLWLATDAAGLSHSLEVYGLRRFIYRSSAGAIASGGVTVVGRALTLRSRGTQRVFVYTLKSTELRLLPDAGDRPREATDLSKMPPHGGTETIYRRRGAPSETWSLDLDSAADLLGGWQVTGPGGRVDTLTFEAGGKFRFQGPGDVAAKGSYVWHDNLLELTDGPVTRRLQLVLACDATGWRLRLKRSQDDTFKPLSDLADMPPAYTAEALWQRPLTPLQESDVMGRFECLDGEVRYRLLLLPGGEARCVIGETAAPCKWQVQGTTLTLTVPEAAGVSEKRRFLVQPLIGGLLLVQLSAPLLGDGEVLVTLPPTQGIFARYRHF